MCRVWSNIQDSSFARSTGCLTTLYTRLMLLLLAVALCCLLVLFAIGIYLLSLAFASPSQVRFKYENTDMAGFVEMTQEWSQGIAKGVITKFRHALLAVPGVTQVKLHPQGTERQQNNPGNHYQEHKFVVSTQRQEKV